MATENDALSPTGQERSLGLGIPQSVSNFIGGGQSNDPNRITPRVPHTTDPYFTGFTFAISPDAIRFWAYIAFWFMCLFAITLTQFYVMPLLEKGPQPDDPATNGLACPPFEANRSVDRSQGFNVRTESHLNEAFGFNNVSYYLVSING